MSYGCIKFTPAEISNKAAIEDILSNIENSFNFLDLDGIIDAYYPDYLHNGDDLADIRYIWEFERMLFYNSLSIEDISIELLSDNTNAIVNFTMILSNEETSLIIIEPDDEDESSYFSKINRQWMIVGNQFK